MGLSEAQVRHFKEQGYLPVPDFWNAHEVQAMRDATIANGALKTIPGAFRALLEHSRDPDSDHHSRCYPDESNAVHIELPAGGVLFFCINMPHATGRNQTDRERAGLAYHFL